MTSKVDFSELLRGWLKDTRVSMAELSKGIGKENERFVATMLSQGTTPKVTDAAAMAAYLGKSIDLPFGLSEPSTQRPSIDEILLSYTRSGGDISSMSDLLPYCDQYRILRAKDRFLKVLDIGSKSEVRRRLGGNIAVFQMSMTAYCLTNRGKALVKDYKLATERRILISEETLDGYAPEVNLRVYARYIRAILRCKTLDGPDRLLTFAVML